LLNNGLVKKRARLDLIMYLRQNICWTLF